MGLFSRGEDETNVHEPRGEYVTDKRIAKIDDVLDAGETVEYLTRGSTVDVEGASGSSLFGDDRSRKTGTRGWVRAAFTADRIVVKVPQWLGSDERSIPYRNVLSVDLDTGLVTKRLSIRTAGPTYHIEADEPGKDECREIASFVRERTNAAQGGDTDTSNETDSAADRLRELEELHDDGLLSDDEYQKKRADLVDQL